MSSTELNNPDRLDQLMVDAATQGLSPQEEAELSSAIDQDNSLRFEAEAYELAATAVEIALAKPDQSESLPPVLRQQLLQSAATHVTLPSTTAAPLRLAGTQANADEKPTFSWTDGRAFGWYVAAAAVIALALVLIQPPVAPDAGRQITDNKTEPKETPSLNEQYVSLASVPNTVSGKWTAHPDGDKQRFAKAKGEVIWNSDQQIGYMKLAGLPVNDPKQQQYQLWIVDETRGSETTDRIDGGVFDVNTAGEVIIPIDSKINARKPIVFAITVEKPGGVVVSKGPLQVFAAVNAES